MVDTCKEFTSGDIVNAVADIPANYRRIVVDSKYRVPSVVGYQAMLRHIHTAQFKYAPKIFDCDDFSRVFQSFANVFFGVNGVGVVLNFGEKHAYNIVFYYKGVHLLYSIVEPQADVSVQASKDPYEWSSNGLIII